MLVITRGYSISKLSGLWLTELGANCFSLHYPHTLGFGEILMGTYFKTRATWLIPDFQMWISLSTNGRFLGTSQWLTNPKGLDQDPWSTLELASQLFRYVGPTWPDHASHINVSYINIQIIYIYVCVLCFKFMYLCILYMHMHIYIYICVCVCVVFPMRG